MTSLLPSARALLVVASCLAAAGCTHDGGGAAASLEDSVTASVPRAQAPVGAPLARRASLSASLPGESVAGTRDQGYADGARRDILLKGGAVRGIQNSITLLARTSRQQTLDDRVPLFKPTEPGIRSEIGGQFPHLAMQVAERESSNAYGPYGLALGRAGGDVRCAYMWQWIDENRLPANLGVAGPVSVRIRLCKAGTTFDAMAEAMDHLTIGEDAPTEQVAALEPIAIIEAPAAAKPARVRHRPARRAEARHREHVATARPHHHETRAARVEEAAPPVSGARYMAASATPTRAPAMPDAPATAPKFSGDLPPQAYLGPSAAQAATISKAGAAARYY